MHLHNYKIVTPLIVFLLMTFFQSGKSQVSESEQIDQFIKTIHQQIPEIPGLSIAIVQGSKPILVKGYGVTRLNNGVPVDENTPFYIASTTKSFMGVLATYLDRQQKLNLESPLSVYQPFNTFSNRSAFDTITIADLLGHTSGISNNFIPFRKAYVGNLSDKEAISLLENASRFGTKSFRYDNLGYNIFELLLSSELGKDWRELLQDELFTPLGMTRSSAYTSKTLEKTKDIAYPYITAQPNGTVEQEIKPDVLMQGAGGLWSSAGDAATWLIHNLSDQSEISKAHQARVTFPRAPDDSNIFLETGYGIGWYQGMFGKDRAIYHFGSYTGYQAHISFLPDHNVGIAVFANEMHIGDNVAHLIARYAYDLMLQQKKQPSFYDEQVTNIINLLERLKKRFAQENEIADENGWQLSNPISAYTGKYINAFMGDITISIKNDKLFVTFGAQSAFASPLSNQESLTVELISGRPMDFTFEIKDGVVTGFTGGGLTFSKE